MTTLLSILVILASILLTAVVFIQNPKGGGLSSDFGSATQIGGIQKTNDVIEKTTWGLAIGIAVISIVLKIQSTPKKVVQQTAPTTEQGAPATK